MDVKLIRPVSERCRNASVDDEVAEDRLVVGVYLGIDADDVVDESDLVDDETVDGDMVAVWQQHLDCGCGRLILAVIVKAGKGVVRKERKSKGHFVRRWSCMLPSQAPAMIGWTPSCHWETTVLSTILSRVIG